MPLLTPLPTAPSRADPANFDTRADAFTAAQVAFVPQLNAVLPTIEAAAGMGTAAATAAANAAASAAAAASSADLAAAVAGGSAGDLPAMRPTLLLDFANSRTVDPRITFSRLSAATRVNALGVIESVPAGVPRLDHDPVTLACKGLLIEGARTNVLLRSCEQEHAAWSKDAVTVTAGTVTAPNGLAAARTITGNAGSAVKRMWQTVAGTSLQWTASVYLRAGTEPQALLQTMSQDGSANCRALVNFAAGTITAATGPGVSGVVARLTPAGGGWWRASLSWAFAVAPTSVRVELWLGGYVSTDSTGTLHVWGAQLESAVAPSSVIETSATSLTRAAENASLTGAAFSGWYRQSEGTFVADAWFGDTVAAGDFPSVFRASDGTNTNRFSVGGASAAGTPRVYAAGIAAGSVQFDLNSASSKYTALPGALLSRALAYRLDDIASSADGEAADVDTIAALPVGISEMSIGSFLGGSHWNGHIRRLAYYPARLLNTQLQALTAP